MCLCLNHRWFGLISVLSGHDLANRAVRQIVVIDRWCVGNICVPWVILWPLSTLRVVGHDLSPMVTKAMEIHCAFCGWSDWFPLEMDS